MIKIDDFRLVGNLDDVIETTGTPDNFNWSSHVDKLVRLAAKHTDYYASDVVISINSVENEIKNYKFEDGDKSWLFGFRDSGVDHTEWVLSSAHVLNHYRAIWRLDISRREGWCDGYFVLKLYRTNNNVFR